MQTGANEMDASLFGDSWSSVVAIPVTAIEKLVDLGVLNDLPGVKQIITTVEGKVTNHVLQATANGLASTAKETLMEEIEYQMPYVVQEIAAVLPGVTGVSAPEWSNGKDGAFDGFWSRQATTFLTMMPLSVPESAKGWNKDKRSQAFAEASPSQLTAYGLSPESIAAITDAKAKGPASLNAAVEQALKNRDPNSEPARTAVEGAGPHRAHAAGG